MIFTSYLNPTFLPYQSFFKKKISQLGISYSSEETSKTYNSVPSSLESLDGLTIKLRLQVVLCFGCPDCQQLDSVGGFFSSAKTLRSLWQQGSGALQGESYAKGDRLRRSKRKIKKQLFSSKIESIAKYFPLTFWWYFFVCERCIF